jgi:hypothetical protein
MKADFPSFLICDHLRDLRRHFPTQIEREKDGRNRHLAARYLFCRQGGNSSTPAAAAFTLSSRC